MDAEAPVVPGRFELEDLRRISLERIPYLLALSCFFLLLVLVNGAFKYFINVRKGALGERLLQRLRYDLFSCLVRFTPEAFRNVKPSEMSSVINNEVEPVGGFVGDAFITPVFLGGQALTALAFIVAQSLALGAIAGLIVVAQAMLIPRLRREQLRLSKQRQVASRALSGQIGEIVEGISAVHSHGTTPYELARIDSRLSQLFDIRFRLYNRKFAVKFINNLLAQVTPFIFYSLGGYLAITGSLDIGQLVAVIAAYRELPPPVKELIDWDQQRMDVQVKYDQVIEQFITSPMIEPGDPASEASSFNSGAIETVGLKVVDPRGQTILEPINLTIPLPSFVALAAQSGDAPDTVARALGRQLMAYSGRIKVAGHDITALTSGSVGRKLAYVGPDAVIFHGTIRDNVAYGLNLVRREDTGSGWDWIDYDAAGASTPDDLDRRILEALSVVGMEETIYRYGLGGTIDPARFPELAARLVEARAAVRTALIDTDSTELIEAFDPAHYNRNATVSENLLFGVPIGATLAGTRFMDDAFIRDVLDKANLTRALTEMGREIAVTMIDIFADLPPGHFLFQQFSFISSDKLSDYGVIVGRLDRGEELTPADAGRLIELTLEYIEPRHRLGLLRHDLEQSIVDARRIIQATMPPNLAKAIEFYDPEHVCAAAPVRDNLLFGRITYGVAGAEERVLSVVRNTIVKLGLAEDIYRLGLDYQTGHGGRQLSPAQRAAISLARAVVKRPSILILNDALVQFGDTERRAIFEKLAANLKGRSLVMTLRNPDLAPFFNQVATFAGPKLRDFSTNMTDERDELPAVAVGE